VDRGVLAEAASVAAAAAIAPPPSPTSAAAGLPAPTLPPRHAVTVTCADGSRVHAHRVVVAVPLPVMKDGDIAFSPPLSQRKVAAAKSMSFANGVKIMLKFNRRPWPADCHGVVAANCFVPEAWMNGTRPPGALIVGKADYSTWFDEPDAEDDAPHGGAAAPPAAPGGAPPASSAAPSAAAARASAGGGPIAAPCVDLSVPPVEPGVFYVVTGFTMGGRADAIVALPQPVVIARFLAQLDRMFGMDASGAFMEGYVHGWGDEPYIRGAYCAVTSESSDAHNDVARAMAEPHCGAVYFAGEATAGTVEAEKRHSAVHFASPIVLHGAMATGSAAACDVARSLGMPVECLAVEGHAAGEHPAHGGAGAERVLPTAADWPPRRSLSCTELRREHVRGDDRAVSGGRRTGEATGYVTPVVPVSTWRARAAATAAAAAAVAKAAGVDSTAPAPAAR
jgi:hypothetical protein